MGERTGDGVLRLTDGSVEWLRGALTGPVDALDLDATYSFDHELNGSRSLARQMHSERDLVWQLLVYEPGGDCLFCPEGGPLARKIVAAAPLYGGSRPSTGPVAFNAAFFLKREFRRRGFGTAVYAHEGDLYRRWGIREVQINATQDGPVVWLKRGFLPKEPGSLKTLYPSWAARNGYDPTPPPSPQIIRSTT